MAGSDREQIIDLMVRYGKGVDTRDWPLLETCFVPDATLSYSSFGSERRGYAAWEEHTRIALGVLDATQHLFTNFLVETDGDTGHLRCSLHAQHVQHAAEDGPLFAVGGTYEIDVIRAAGAWKITRLEFTPIWMSGNPKVLEHIMDGDVGSR